MYEYLRLSSAQKRVIFNTFSAMCGSAGAYMPMAREHRTVDSLVKMGVVREVELGDPWRGDLKFAKNGITLIRPWRDQRRLSQFSAAFEEGFWDRVEDSLIWGNNPYDHGENHDEWRRGFQTGIDLHGDL